MLLKMVAIIVACFVGAIGSAKLAGSTSLHNRATEWPQNEKSEELSDSVRQWTIVHIRDDVGGIHNLLVVTNALLAGLLAALLF